MGYETSKFGDAGYTSGSTNVQTNVNNHYGVRYIGKTVGEIQTQGSMREASWDIDGTMIGDAAFALDAPIIPAGAIIERVIVEVQEVFVVGGTSPTINVGTEGSENTNGFEVTEAQAEAAGTYDVTASLQGTWAAPLAAATTVGLNMDGTSPTITSAGKMRVVVYYNKV